LAIWNDGKCSNSSRGYIQFMSWRVILLPSQNVQIRVRTSLYPVQGVGPENLSGWNCTGPWPLWSGCLKFHCERMLTRWKVPYHWRNRQPKSYWWRRNPSPFEISVIRVVKVVTSFSTWQNGPGSIVRCLRQPILKMIGQSSVKEREALQAL
jgi:hypothetical protein